MMRNICSNGMMNNVTPSGFAIIGMWNGYNHGTPSVFNCEDTLNLKLETYKI